MRKLVGLLLFGLLAWGSQGQEAGAQDKTFTNTIGMEFVLIPAGGFSFKWTAETTNDFGEKSTNQHQRVMTFSKPFYLGKYDVTQEQWVAVMGSNPSYNKGRTNPVESVSWGEVQEFIQKLNQKEGGKKYRLPTEAEWEYAARARSDTEYFYGNDPGPLGQYAWFKDNSQGTTHPVGEKKPNPWGLYDIYGNVAEWVQDWYDDNKPGIAWFKEGPVTDPTGPAEGSARVVRGCGWGDNAEGCRSGDRTGIAPGFQIGVLGFRLAFSPGQAELSASPEQAERIAYKPEDLDRWLEEYMKTFSGPYSRFDDLDEENAFYAEAAAKGNIFVSLSLEFVAGHLFNDEAEALKWEKASQANNVAATLEELAASDARAHTLLGFVYRSGLAGVTADIAQADALWRKAAAQGNAQAQFCLGSLYAEGIGVNKDMAQAADWFRKAAAQGNAQAREALAKL